ADEAAAAGLASPALIVVGGIVAMRAALTGGA
ncbi:MAG: uroporphyrin-III methyltransferase, partial [Mesorhizobium sp.]